MFEINGKRPDESDAATGSATYCPEDDKLRLYVGRVSRATYEWLRAMGYQSTPKQDCDFAAVWTPRREDAALWLIEDGDDIGDEDQSPEDRAADRAERFAGYRDKRRAEAHGLADRYESGPSAYGNQDGRRAERAAARRDRVGTRAVSQWSKAEYWTARTAGVISHALYSSSPKVRRGRIVRLETELRKLEKGNEEARARRKAWQAVRDEADPTKAYQMAYTIANTSGGWHYKHPRREDERETSMYSLLTDSADPITGHEAAAIYFDRYPVDTLGPGSYPARWVEHYRLRIAYENQMIGEQGGKATDADIEPGGFFGTYRVWKVNRSPATGLVVSVGVYAPHPYRPEKGETLQTLNIQRLGEKAYRAPTDEERAEFERLRAEKKAAAKANRPAAPKLINPTHDEAQRLQEHWNAANLRRWKEGAGKYTSSPPPASEVLEMTQAQYAARSRGSYASCYTVFVCDDGEPYRQTNMYGSRSNAPKLCKVRVCSSGTYRSAYRVVRITDKPGNPLPAWTTTEAAAV